MADNHPLLNTPDEAWYGSPVEPGFSRLDLGRQIASARQPDRFVHGDALNGWAISESQPSYDNQSWGKQNLLRARLNDLENPRGLLGDNQSYDTEVQDLIDKGRGEFNAWKNSDDALKQFIPFGSSNQDDLAPILEASDPNWNGIVEWRKWEKEHPEVASFLTTARGIIPEEAFGKTRNQDAFMLTINMEMTRAQIQQEIDQYERNSGSFEKWSQFIGGGAFRQFVMDSDAAKTIGLGAIGKAVGGTAQVLKGARFVSLIPKAERALSLVEKVGTPSGLHNVLSKNLKLGTLGAMAVEGAATGALYDAQHQIGMQRIAEMLGSQPLEYDVGDTFKAAGIGSLFGMGMYGGVRVIGGMTNRLAQKQRGVDAALAAIGMEDAPIARHGFTPEGLVMQAHEEDAAVKINRTLADSTDERLGFLLSKNVIEGSGRTMAEAGAFADQIALLKQKGIRINDGVIVEALDDFLGQGTLKSLTTEEQFRVEKAAAREEVMAMAQSNPEWRNAMTARLEAMKSAIGSLNELKGDVVFRGTEKGLVREEMILAPDLAAVLEPVGIRPKQAMGKTEVLQHLNDQVAQIENMLTMPADPREAALHAVRGSATAEAAIAASGYVPKSTAGRLLLEIGRHLGAIEEQTQLGGKGSGNAVKAAREEIKRLTSSLKSIYGDAPKRARKARVVAPTARALDRLPQEEQAKVLGDIIDNLDASPNEVMQSTTIMSKGLKAVGYEGPIQKFLLNRTGIYTTARSPLRVMREAAALFGSPDYNARVFAGRGGAGVGVIAAMGRAERDVSSVKMFLEEFANRKGMTDDLFRQFNADVESAMNMKVRMPKGHQFEKEGNKLIDMWHRYVEQTLARGKRYRAIRPSKESKVSTFLPLVVHEPYLRTHFKEAVEDLAGVWQRAAAASEHLNPEYMEKLGWIERPTDKWGNRVGKVIYKPDAPIDDLFKAGEQKAWPKRANLTPEGRAMYETAVKDPSALHGSAETYWVRFLREDGRATDVRTINDKVYGSNSRNPHKRKITQRMLEENPQLKQYFNRDLFTMAERYAKTAGFKAHVGESINRQFGVNATLGQMMNALEAKMKFEFKGDPEMTREIEKGWDKMHEMTAWVSGNLPNTDPSYSVASRYAFDFLSKTASLPVMGGMAAANGWEAMARMFTMVHSPADLGRNMKALIRGLFADRSVLREELAGMSQDLRRLAVGYAHQLQAGRVDAAYELTTKGVLTRPWKDAYNIAIGRTRSGNYGSRAAATALAGLDALNKNAYVMGGGPRIQHASEVIMAGAAQREFMRYSDALVKLRGLMEANPIDPGDTQKAHKQFAQMTRSAGFGDRWDVAQRFIRWDLHESGIVESIQEAAKSAGVKNKIHVTTNDLLEQYAAMPAGKARDDLYEALQRHNQYVDDRIKEELGETTAWTVRTDRRSPQGRALDLFTNYMHNMYFHKMSKSSSMPSRVFLGVVTGLTISELLQKVTQDYLQGVPEEQMLAQWDTPEEALGSTLSTAMRIPMFGAVSFIPKYIADTGIDTLNRQMGNDSINPYQPKFGGVVGSALDNMFRLGRGAGTWAFALTNNDADRGRRIFANAGIRYLPIINTVYGKAAVRTFTDLKERYGRRGQYKPVGSGDGRSIWGDEDMIRPKDHATETNPEMGSTGFDLAAALTQRKH